LQAVILHLYGLYVHIGCVWLRINPLAKHFPLPVLIVQLELIRVSKMSHVFVGKRLTLLDTTTFRLWIVSTRSTILREIPLSCKMYHLLPIYFNTHPEDFNYLVQGFWKRLV